MKVAELKPEQLQAELKKTIKVRAVGEPDIYVGYYNHLRRRGGDVFILRPLVRDRAIKVQDPISKRMIATKKTEKILITAEEQFSERWMEKVDNSAKENMPKHFNEIGRGNAANKNKLNIPGMTQKVGGDDKAAMAKHDAGGVDVTEGVEDIATAQALAAAAQQQGGGAPAGGGEPSVI